MTEPPLRPDVRPLARDIRERIGAARRRDPAVDAADADARGPAARRLAPAEHPA